MLEYTERQEDIDESSALARRSFERVDLRSTDMPSPDMPLRASPANSTAGCIGLVPENGQVCLRVSVVRDLSVPADPPEALGRRAAWTSAATGRAAGVCVRLRVQDPTMRRGLQSALLVVLTGSRRPPPGHQRRLNAADHPGSWTVRPEIVTSGGTK
jgi:hypothetical protein